MSETLAQKPVRRLFTDERVLLVVIVTAAVALRLWGLGSGEVLTDEGNYALRAIGWNDFNYSTTLQTPWVWWQTEERLPWWTPLSFADHPPLHFGLIWLATHLLGISLFAVRLPSALLGVASVLLVMAIGRRLGWGRASLVSGAFLALLPWHIYISRQAIQESGVMFWLLLGLWLWLVGRERPRWWALSGVAFGAAMLTKYSGIIWLPLWLVLRRTLHRRTHDWIIPLAAFALLLPVAVYNAMLYTERGHFDLQVSRAAGLDTREAWAASEQQLWQGKLANVWPYLQRQVVGVSLPIAVGAAVVLLWFGRRRWRQWLRDAGFHASAGMSLLGAALVLATLDDYGRGSIVLPFYALAVGFAASLIPAKRITFASTLVVLLLGTAAVGDRLRVPLLPDAVVANFTAETTPLGFDAWERWRASQVPTRLTPHHFASLLDFLWYHARRVPDPSLPLVVYDGRITWFAMNWYFYRYSSYALDATFLPANLYALLFANGFITQMPDRDLTYVQIENTALDTKPVNDQFSQMTDDAMHTLFVQQHPLPTIIRNDRGDPLLRVWPLRWTLGASVTPAATGTTP